MTVISYAVTFLWLSYLPVAIIQLRGWLKNRKVYVNMNLARIHNDPHIIFQIMTRSASVSDVVSRGIDSVHAACKSISYSTYSVCVVTEDPNDSSHLSAAEVILVPKEYRPKGKAIRKARALQYAVERRRAANVESAKRWIFHMDEESVVTSQTVLSLLAFIRDGKGLISEGPIVYPMKLEHASRITILAESIRPFQCYDCVSQMTHPPPMYMHGSNLLVRSDVEGKVGWDHGETVAEDQLFGVRLHEKYSPVFGWHGGILLEQPPLTLGDHFRQRRRWVTGTLQNLKYLPSRMRLRIYLRASTYWLGFASAVASIAMYVYYFSPELAVVLDRMLGIPYKPPSLAKLPIATPQSIANSLQGGQLVLTWQSFLSLGIGICLLVAFAIWIASYQIGLHTNLKYTTLSMGKRLTLHFQQLLFSPLVGIIETFPAFFAVLEFYLFNGKMRDFEVISK